MKNCRHRTPAGGRGRRNSPGRRGDDVGWVGLFGWRILNCLRCGRGRRRIGFDPRRCLRRTRQNPALRRRIPYRCRLGRGGYPDPIQCGQGARHDGSADDHHAMQLLPISHGHTCALVGRRRAKPRSGVRASRKAALPGAAQRHGSGLLHTTHGVIYVHMCESVQQFLPSVDSRSHAFDGERAFNAPGPCIVFISLKRSRDSRRGVVKCR